MHFSVALSVASFLCNNFLSCTVCKKRNFCKSTSFIWRKYFLCCYNTGIGFSLFVWIMQVLPLETYNETARSPTYLQLFDYLMTTSSIVIYRRTSKTTYYDNFLFTLHSTVENTNLTMVMYNFDEIKIKSFGTLMWL